MKDEKSNMKTVKSNLEDKFMNQEDLINEVSKKLNGKAQAKEIVKSLFSSIRNALAKGDSVSLKGFGTFKVTKRKARKGINPRTGEKIDIPEKKVPRFIPAKSLKEELN